jgi:hypothetical protein
VQGGLEVAPGLHRFGVDPVANPARVLLRGSQSSSAMANSRRVR